LSETRRKFGIVGFGIETLGLASVAHATTSCATSIHV